jgi:sugar/nucleoside kinase (ribokinase family)
MKPDDKISLCTSVEKDNTKLFDTAYNFIDKSYFEFVPEIPKVYLNISADKEREECYSRVNNSLYVNIPDFNLFDGILINMITGFDIKLSKLKEIRSLSKGLIYFDVHTLARGVDKKGKREFRVIPDFSEWASNIDILQVNESEFNCLFEGSTEKEIIKKTFNAGVKILIVTKSVKGAKLYYKLKREIVSIFISGEKIIERNKVGCGDIFGAVYFYHYISSDNILYAFRKANLSAGIAAAGSNIEDF